ncbi:MAG: hypothetical protein GFH27_549291n334 [Chloroflexi bacterium AL-W]|nr:hypothetical protein [Chloroflexi bacterium AL-N1]NOK67198.1 hypothetical protein [Chloroflexi bacterium AL-N10]NOK75308.1 hypothetical protein [Chloroflexi bacterium AL-N5]NOK82096.1 hypothetical protein [Chloroflexi bacterium AL-W]NOK89941.1 hypothetical protein [Chloroflexi bacterium AL-N15]
MSTIKIAIIGAYNETSQAQNTLIPALEHAANAFNLVVKPYWILTTTLSNSQSIDRFYEYDGIIGSPGEVHNLDVTLRGIQFARERNIPLTSSMQCLHLHGTWPPAPSLTWRPLTSSSHTCVHYSWAKDDCAYSTRHTRISSLRKEYHNREILLQLWHQPCTP